MLANISLFPLPFQSFIASMHTVAITVKHWASTLWSLALAVCLLLHSCMLSPKPIHCSMSAYLRSFRRIPILVNPPCSKHSIIPAFLGVAHAFDLHILSALNGCGPHRWSSLALPSTRCQCRYKFISLLTVFLEFRIVMPSSLVTRAQGQQVRHRREQLQANACLDSHSDSPSPQCTPSFLTHAQQVQRQQR